MAAVRAENECITRKSVWVSVWISITCSPRSSLKQATVSGRRSHTFWITHCVTHTRVHSPAISLSISCLRKIDKKRRRLPDRCTGGLSLWHMLTAFLAKIRIILIQIPRHNNVADNKETFTKFISLAAITASYSQIDGNCKRGSMKAVRFECLWTVHSMWIAIASVGILPFGGCCTVHHRSRHLQTCVWSISSEFLKCLEMRLRMVTHHWWA